MLIALAITLVGCLALIVIGVLASKWLNIQRDAVQFNRKKMAAVRAAKAKSSHAATLAERPEWLLELLESLGVSEDVLDSDEPPDELSSLLNQPVVKAFLESGGLEKLMGGASPESESVVTGREQGFI